jgi:sterol desaturase/sphingolipid hydroxylase (fatty acid hydroxylase superfamily)
MILLFTLISLFISIYSFTISELNTYTYFFDLTTLNNCMFAYITLFFGYMSELFFVGYLLEKIRNTDGDSIRRQNIMINEMKVTIPSILVNDFILIVWMKYFDTHVDNYLWSTYSLSYRLTPLHLLLSLIVFLSFHDTWNYWWHVMFHKYNFLWKYHKIHHQFYNPTAFSFGSVHPLEGVILGIVPIIIVKMICPFHPLMIMLCMNIILVYAALAHDGGPFDLINHYVHHTKGGKRNSFNYGMFFPIWDKIMRTNYVK